ncbi:MAG: primary-amine oxidase [Gammaproteobacteria bacterium]|nr:primary-amine oxidase [Gammaproteobacteria bacterium]
MLIDHPLYPVTGPEIEKAVALFSRSHQTDEQRFFSSVALVEPSKSVVRGHVPGDAIPRVLRLLGVDSQSDGGFQVDVDVTGGVIVDFRRLSADAQAPYGYADIGIAVQLTKSNPEWLAALRAREITDIENVQVDPWPAGGYPHRDIAEGHRAMRCISFVREDKTDNGYARPIHGLIAHVDLTERRVAHIEDFGIAPMPPNPGRFDAAHQEEIRDDLRTLEIRQPDGPSFEVDGYHVCWQGWDFRISMHPVHGLVLHQLSLAGRSVLYRASLSEMVVPYGDRDPMHSWKHVMDASEYCMGTLVNSLRLGCDCLGEIHYFDIDQVTWEGKVRTIENAICIHEEDYGIQWKHYDGHSQTSEVRRSRRLVVSSIHTIGNYDYGFYWYLYLDGTIQMEIKLTGIVGVSAVDDTTHNAQHAPLVGVNLASPVHQHLFCFRLDWDLDSGTNSLYESEIEALPMNDDNPDGTQFKSVSRHLTNEDAAKRVIAPQFSRIWKVVNHDQKNALGVPVAYKLLPGASPILFAHPDSVVAKRAAFARHNLWATPFEESEDSAAGPLTAMHRGQDGLPDYTQHNRDISECDLVMWHTFGLTHVPRPEDWPVMPVEYCGFHLIPVGFFDRNPTLDLPSGCHPD